MKVVGLKYFELEELVDKPIIEQFGLDAVWQLDFRLAQDVDTLRGHVGGLGINNYLWGGERHESGVRLHTTPTGAASSQHRRGCAFDLHPSAMSVMDLYHYIIANRALYPNIRAIENPLKTVTWLHVDSRWTGQDAILIVEP